MLDLPFSFGNVWLALLVFAGFAVFWVVQFVHLMSLDAAVLPGPHDRLVWGAVFVLLWVLAPFAFLVWKNKNERLWQREA